MQIHANDIYLFIKWNNEEAKGIERMKGGRSSAETRPGTLMLGNEIKSAWLFVNSATFLGFSSIGQAS